MVIDPSSNQARYKSTKTSIKSGFRSNTVLSPDPFNILIGVKTFSNVVCYEK